MSASRTGRRAETRRAVRSVPPATRTNGRPDGPMAWLRPLRHPSDVPGRRTIEFAVLLLLTLALTFIGLIMVLSASTVTGVQESGSPWGYLERQGLWAFVGLLAMSVLMRLDYRDIARFAPVVLVVTTAMLVALLVPGGHRVTANGATRWLSLGPITIQPSELAKLALALFAADLIARRSHLVHDNRAVLAPVLVVSMVLAGLVLLQPSQGTATIIVAVAMIMLFLGGVSVWSMGSITIALLMAFAAFALSSPYRRARLDAWADPFSDPEVGGYQIIQALVAVASGGIDGVGLGEGRAKWGFLPFAHTDFIFSVVAEELGFIGALMLILFYVGLVLFGMRVAFGAPDQLGMLLAGGITTAIAMQAFINIGAAVNVLPISGVTLPFVSMGGSSLMVNLAAMGVVLNVARQVQR